MGDPRGFLRIRRAKGERRPVAERVHDYRELDLPLPEATLREQASRCMDCGIPFCHSGCPLGNVIPDWNDLVYNGRMAEASAALHATNNFPEITGRVCPAPCEAACVLSIGAPGAEPQRDPLPRSLEPQRDLSRSLEPSKNGVVAPAPVKNGASGAEAPKASEGAPVTIKAIERAIADRAFAEGWVRPRPPAGRTGKKVVVIGSGPAGLAAAQELARAGPEVTVLEKADRVGGLLRYGIPDFKLEKTIVERRVAELRAEGVVFKTGVHAGVDPTGDELRARFDAVVLCGGAMRPRELDVPGRELGGVHLAMDFLTQQNRRVAGDVIPDGEAILATGKRVLVLGGGDTGSDCVGTAHRHGALSVTSLELMPRPPDARREDNPWPAWPLVLRTSSSHEEGGERDFGVLTRRLVGEPSASGRAPRVVALEAVRVELRGGKLEAIPGSEVRLPCDLVLLAMGFVGPVREGLLEQLGVALDARGNVATTAGHTSVPGVFAAGDMARGQSLVVWAIAEGRSVARSVDAWLAASAGSRAASAPPPP